MKWSPKQAKALDAIAAWLKDPNSKQTFCLFGLAGSGKSEILKHAVGDFPGAVRWAAPTGKAALVMRRKGCPTAQTVHSLIYNVSGDAPSPEMIAKLREEMIRLRAVQEPGAQASADRLAEQIARAEQDDSRSGPRFSLNLNSDLCHAKLCVVDEGSMIDDRMGRDLESFGCKLLIVGDPAQLPPIYGAGYFISREPDAFLDEIHRQALDSPILYLADLARRGQPLPYGKHGDCEVLRYGDPSLERRALETDMILVGRNKTRHACNTKIRKLLGRHEEPAPVKGDKAICLRNNPLLGLLNGSSWTIDRCTPNLAAMTAKIEVTNADDGEQVECETWLHHFMAREDELKSFARRAYNEWDYGWAQSVHKCVALDTIVETPRGLERIDEIAELGKIATHEGMLPYTDRVVYPAASMFRITTHNGYTLDTTANHGLFVWNAGCGYERRMTSDLKVGDTLQFLLEPVSVLNKLAELPPPPPRLDVRAKEYLIPTHVSADVAEWLGLMVGDGTVYQRGFRLAKRHEDVVERFAWLSHSIFAVGPKRGFTLGTPHAEVNSVQLAQWCRSIGGLSPNQKGTPRAIRHSPIEIQARFLRGLFEDGTVNIKNGRLDHIEWSSCQEVLAREVQIMLLRFGIIASRRERDGQWLLYIYGVNAHRFRDRIGFVSSFKNARLAAPVGKETRYKVPLTAAELAALRPLLSVSERQNVHAVGHMSRETARRYGHVSSLLRERLRYLHDAVANVTRLPDAPSACVTVPGLGRFLQNGSPQANSQGSQFLSVLLFDESKQFGKDACRHLYTGLTRAVSRVEVVV